MGGCYGDFLLAFPEQFTSITVFDMAPKINGGWVIDEDSYVTVKGLYQHIGGQSLRENNGNLEQGSKVEFWSETPGLNNKFTTIDGKIFRLKNDWDWIREGGFTHYGLERVDGNDGTESVDTSWNLGGNNFG